MRGSVRGGMSRYVGLSFYFAAGFGLVELFCARQSVFFDECSFGNRGSFALGVLMAGVVLLLLVALLKSSSDTALFGRPRTGNAQAG